MKIQMCNSCVFARRVYVNYEGYVDLLDMEHIECYVSGQPEIKEIGYCINCEDSEMPLTEAEEYGVVPWHTLVNAVQLDDSTELPDGLESLIGDMVCEKELPNPFNLE